MVILPPSHTSSHFNPRSREGSDKNALYPPKIMVISIHAPVKGATVKGVIIKVVAIFQSTLP